MPGIVAPRHKANAKRICRMRETFEVTVGAIAASLTGLLWHADESRLPKWRGWGLRVLRVSYALIRDLREGQLTLRAMSLVYTTILSLVPLLAISFSILKGFGVHNQVEPVLLNLLAPLGDKGVEISERIVGFVDNVKVGVLGSLGFVLLFYTVVSLMQKIERAFNYVWQIKTERSIGQRFRDYISVLVVGPTLVFASVGITASVMSASVVEALSAIEPFGTVVELVGRTLPYLMIMLAFAFMYMFIPNTKVQVRPALIGGFVAGLLWNSAGWAFASFVVGSAKYTAIYSTFAALIFFLIWLYLAWLILLTGTSIAYYVQYPARTLSSRENTTVSSGSRERLALLVMQLIVQHFYSGKPAWNSAELGARLAAPPDVLEEVLTALERTKLIVKTATEPEGFMPGMPPETTATKSVLDAVRWDGTEESRQETTLAKTPAVEKLMSVYDSAIGTALSGHTLKDLAESPDVELREIRGAESPSMTSAG